jgi:hypothetical protein
MMGCPVTKHGCPSRSGPAVQNFNGSDFAVPVPITRRVSEGLQEATVVFTHHTMYEEYTHYVPGSYWRSTQKGHIQSRLC